MSKIIISARETYMGIEKAASAEKSEWVAIGYSSQSPGGIIQDAQHPNKGTRQETQVDGAREHEANLLDSFSAQAAALPITLFIIGVLAGAFSIYIVEWLKNRKKRKILRSLLRDEVLYFHVPTLFLNLHRGKDFWKSGGECHIQFTRFSTTAYDHHVATIIELLGPEEVFQILAHYKRMKDLSLYFGNDALQQEEDRKTYLEDSAYALAFAYGLAELLGGSRDGKKCINENLKILRDFKNSGGNLTSAEQLFREYGFIGFADAIKTMKKAK